MRSIYFGAVAAFAMAQNVAAADLCKGGPRDQWLTEAEIAKHLAAIGYTEFRLTVEDGCIEAISDQHGKHMEFYMEPLTGEIVKIEEE